MSKNEFHKARRFTPFADQAPMNASASLLLRIALQHGFLGEEDYKKHATEELTLDDLKGKLTPQQITAVLDQISRGVQVDESAALYATTHNPRVSKWMPGRGNRVAKNK